MSKIGENIKIARERAGLTQDELAQKLGYKTRSSIAKIENGTNDIPQSKIVSIADALDTTPQYLMGWERTNSKYEEFKERLNEDAKYWYYVNNDSEKANNFHKNVVFDVNLENETKHEKLVLLNRNAQKLKEEDLDKLMDVARAMFKEEFNDE